MSRVDQLRAAGAYLTPGRDYYSPERISQMTRVFDIVDGFRLCPRTCISIGAGGRQEPLALQVKFPSLEAVVPIDLSKDALDDLKVGYSEGYLFPVEADAVDLPFRAGSFDLAVAKSVMHEVASYSSGGVTSWAETIRELMQVLRPGGVLYYLDFAAPDPAIVDYSQQIEVHLRSEEAIVLYDAMREHYRTFENGLWARYHAERLDSRRLKFQDDFPGRFGGTSVTLGVAQAGEFFLHLLPFINDSHNGIYPEEDKYWKEMQEMYFLRDEGGLYSPQRQIELITGIAQAQSSAAKIDYRLWNNAMTDRKIVQFIEANMNTGSGASLANEELFAHFTKKLIVAVQK